MAVQLEDLIRQGVFDIELNVNDPRITGFSAGDGAMGKALDGTRWVKIGPNDTDWEQLLITTDGSFVANIELADVSDIILPTNVLGVKDGTLTLGDGSTQGGVEIISASSTGHSSFTFVYSDGGNITIKTDTSIAANAYNGDNAITSIIFGDRVTSIGANAFYSATNLRGDLFIPNSVESIGAYAFLNTGFDGKLVLPKNPSYTTIESWTFASLQNLTGDLAIPYNVTTINEYAFTGTYCGNLKLSNNLTTIGLQSFAGATITGDLVIPDSVEFVESVAFATADISGSLTLSKNPSFTVVNHSCFYDVDITGDLIIPPNITSIEQSAFTALNVDTLTIYGLSSYLYADAFQGTANRVEILETSPSTTYYFSYLTITDGQIHVPTTATGYPADYNGNTVVKDIVL